MNFIDRKLYRFAWWRRWRGLPPPVSLTVDAITRQSMIILDHRLKEWSTINREYKDK